MTSADRREEAHLYTRLLEIIDGLTSREAVLEQAFGPEWEQMVAVLRRSGGLPAWAVDLADVLWKTSEQYHQLSVELLRLAREHSLGDFDVNVLEQKLDERLRKETGEN